jgi:hypothetical protein
MLLGLIEAGDRRRQLATCPRRLPEPAEVGLEEVEDEPVALVEGAFSSPELERLQVGRRRGDVYFELVLDPEGAERDLVETSSMELALTEEVRDHQRPEVTLEAAQADGALVQLDDVEVVEAVPIPHVRVTRPVDLEQVARYVIVLAIEDRVGPNELSQFDEQVARKRLVAAEALGLADEAEQPLRVTSRKD